MSDAAINLKLAIAIYHFAMVARDYNKAASYWLEARHIAEAIFNS